MSGHSKWSQIKRKKAVTDAKKSKIFSRLTKEITLQVRLAGGDTTSPAVRTAIERARTENMPADTIDRAVKKATETKENMERITYEAYGPGGVGIMIEALTDNRNKAAQEIKHILVTHGATLGAPGSVVWAFEKDEEGWHATQPTETTEVVTESVHNLVDALEENEEVDTVHTTLLEE